MNRLLRFHVLFFVATVVLDLAIPCAAHALDRQTIRDRLEEIGKMSSFERNRLETNIEEFRALSEAERDHYRSLHSQILKDRGQTGGSMLQVLQSYDLWLQTLTPAQQNELHNEKEVSRKMALVHRFKAEQEQQLKQEFEQPNDATGVKGPLPRKIESVARTDLDAIVQVIVNDLPADRKRPEFEPLRLSQYIDIINTSLETKDSPKDWPDKNLLSKMKQAATPRIAKAVELYVVWDDKSERDTMVRLILMGIDQQINASVRIPKDVLDRVFDSLSKDEQSDFKKLRTARAKNVFLTARYYQSRNNDTFEMAKIYKKDLVDLSQRLEIPLPTTELRQPKRSSTKK